MSLKQIQYDAADVINADATLLQGSVLAIAEDKGDLINQIETAIAKMGIVAIVSVPSAVSKSEASRIIVAEATLAIQIVESPLINRGRANSLTASEAAEQIACLLHLNKLPCGFLPVFRKISPEAYADEYIVYNIEFSGTAALGE